MALSTEYATVAVIVIALLLLYLSSRFPTIALEIVAIGGGACWQQL